MEDMPLSFSCSDCQRHFPNLPELSRHRELLHSAANQDKEEADGIPHPYCSQPGSLANHQRNHETGIRGLVLGKAGKIRQSMYKRNMNGNLGLIPWQLQGLGKNHLPNKEKA